MEVQNQSGKTTETYFSDPLRFLTLQELIPADLQEKRLRVRAQLQTYLLPIINGYVESAEFPFEIIPKLQQLHLCGLEKAGYGCRAITHLEKALALYEIAKIDSGVATFLLVQSSLALKSIELLGSEAQKNKYLKKLVDLEMIGCFALTEPNFGSDASGLETSATPVKGGYLINGCKRWIGNASHSHIMIVWARNTTNKKVEGFIVDSKSAGIEIGVIKRKLALRPVQNADIAFKDVFVPESEKLEKARNYQEGVNVILNSSRMFVPWIAIGMMGGVYEIAFKYCRDRHQFQAPIGAYQLVQEKLARILEYFSSAFLQGWRLVTMENCEVSQSASVKAWITSVGQEVTRLAREILGGNGILIDNYVMKAMLDMEAIYTYEGTYEINTLIVGRAITGISAFKSSFKL